MFKEGGWWKSWVQQPSWLGRRGRLCSGYGGNETNRDLLHLFAMNKYNPVLARPSYLECSLCVPATLLGPSTELRPKPQHRLKAGACSRSSPDIGRDMETPALGSQWSKSQDREDPQPSTVTIHAVKLPEADESCPSPGVRVVRTSPGKVWMWPPGLNVARLTRGPELSLDTTREPTDIYIFLLALSKF